MKWLSILPTLALAVLILSSCAQKEASAPTQTPTPAQAASEPKEIKLTAKNFEFEPGEVHVKKGDKVKITFDNKEGAHGLSIPEFKVQLNKPGSIEFVADHTGTFPISCSVVCGVGHAKMAGTLNVD